MSLCSQVPLEFAAPDVDELMKVPLKSAGGDEYNGFLVMVSAHVSAS